MNWGDQEELLYVATLRDYNRNLDDLVKTLEEIGEVPVTCGLKEGTPAIRLEATELNTEVNRLMFLTGLHGLFPEVDLSRIIFTNDKPTSVWVSKPVILA